jgi:hypothetical protein
MVTYDAVGPSASGTAGASSPLTWAHVNNGNAVFVGVTIYTGSSNTVTAVTYGGVTLDPLGFVRGNNGSTGGVALYGKVGGLPTGSNTVSVSFSDAANHNAGSVSLAGAGSLGSPLTSYGSGSTQTSASFTTTSGGMLVGAFCFGNKDATFAASGGSTVRWSHMTSSSSSADNGAQATKASPGGAATIATTTGAYSDDWGCVAVEVLPAGAGAVTADAGLASGAASAPAPARAGAGTGWLYAGADAGISGSWANLPGAVGSGTGTYTTWTSSAAGAAATLELSGFGAQAAVPSGSTIDGASVKVRHSEDPAAQVTSITAQAYDGTSPIGSPQALTVSASVHEDEVALPALTYAQLADLRIRLTATRAG